MVADKPEQQARAEIDRLLAAAGWAVQDFKAANIQAARGVALREFQLKDGYGEADYLLYVDARAAGVLEAKKKGFTLSGVETQSDKYSKGLPDALPAWRKPAPATPSSATPPTTKSSARRSARWLCDESAFSHPRQDDIRWLLPRLGRRPRRAPSGRAVRRTGQGRPARR